MNVADFLLMSEVKIMGYGESDTSGAWMKLQITPEELAVLRGRKGECCEITLRIIDHMTGQPADTSGDGEKDEVKKGSLAYKMHRNGYFYNPKLWEAMESAGIYTQEDHKAWLETLPCYSRHNAQANWNEFTGVIVITEHLKQFLESLCNCTGDPDRRIVHHTRDAVNAGTATKPPDWWGIPTCDYHHRLAHSSAVTPEFNKSLIEYAAGLTAHRMKEVMKNHLGLASLSELTEEMLSEFEDEIGL